MTRKYHNSEDKINQRVDLHQPQKPDDEIRRENALLRSMNYQLSLTLNMYHDLILKGLCK
jgi:hypothetical protein